jgi:hypothetical protein
MQLYIGNQVQMNLDLKVRPFLVGLVLSALVFLGKFGVSVFAGWLGMLPTSFRPRNLPI